MKQFVLFLTAIFFLLLLGCGKSPKNCNDPLNIQINTDKSTYYLGNDMTVSGEISSAYTYQWTGPGGWTSNQGIASRNNLQMQDAGNYSVTIFNSFNCPVFTGTKNIQVLPIPNPTCIIPTNTTTSSIPGFANFSFPVGVSAYAYQSSFLYIGVASNNTDRIDIQFSGTNQPKQGLYKTYNSSATTLDDVNITVRWAGVKYNAIAGNEVFVNTIGGKQVVSFCFITMQEFLNPANQFTFTGKLAPF